MRQPEPELPKYSDLLLPVLATINDAHGTLAKREVDEAVVERAGITPEQLSISYPSDAQAKGSKVLHRIAFARSSMKACGALDNPQRGIWTLTPVGRALLALGDEAIRQADADARKSLPSALKRQAARPAPEEPEAQPVERSRQYDPQDGEAGPNPELADLNWREQLLERVQALPPDAFERLCARLLRIAGCIRVEVTQRSDDEGIDGVGILEVSLLSFPVFFQAKRYRSLVGPAVVRELRGAMAGRGDKGILITSGTVSKRARDEATRPGTPPIDLIDGDRLCDLLLVHQLGVELQPVVDEAFFADL